MPDDFIVKSRVYDRFADRQIGSDFFEAANEKLEEILDRAAERAEENGRKTIQARDV